MAARRGFELGGEGVVLLLTIKPLLLFLSLLFLLIIKNMFSLNVFLHT